MEVKFKDFVYKRPDLENLDKNFKTLISEFKNSQNADDQYKVWMKINLLRNNFETQNVIAYLRYIINTTDEFYKIEHKYFDNIMPEYQGLLDDFRKALLESAFRNELVIKCGSHLFGMAELSIKTYSREITDDLKIENNLVTEYMNLRASGAILFRGEERTMPAMEFYMKSVNREVRKTAYESVWKFFQDNEKEFDRIFDELVKVRTRIAKKLGYENFIQLGYDRLNRTGYTYKDVSGFRNSVKEFVVPLILKSSNVKKKILGIDHLYYYDSGIELNEGNPVPKGGQEYIIDNAKRMFEELSEETGVFINIVIDKELMDLFSRKGKAGFGYSTYIPDHKSPFIFMNMNGTSNDVSIFIHEAGHSFQSYIVSDFDIIENMYPTMEAGEIHSMAMELLTWPWMKLFFKEDTEKFFYSVLISAFKFIQYSAIVDEFQHFVYANPEISPEERRSEWRSIEKKYDPTKDYDHNDFLEGGGFWFRNALIFKDPFYYIDYALAQICSLQLWRKSNQDRNSAWDDYLRLCKAGGSKPFLELLKIAKIESPFDKNVVESIIKYSDEWLNRFSKFNE